MYTGAETTNTVVSETPRTGRCVVYTGTYVTGTQPAREKSAKRAKTNLCIFMKTSLVESDFLAETTSLLLE